MVKTWKTSTDPDYEAKKNRVLELYAIADGKRARGEGDPSVVICIDEFGALILQLTPVSSGHRRLRDAATSGGDTAASLTRSYARSSAGGSPWNRRDLICGDLASFGPSVAPPGPHSLARGGPMWTVAA